MRNYTELQRQRPSPASGARRPIPTECMNISMNITAAPRSARLRLAGDLNYGSVDELVDTASQVLAEHADLADLHLNFSDLTFLDSAAVSGLLLIHRPTSHSGVGLHLDHRPAFLDRLLRVTGLFGHLVTSNNAGAVAD
jgi:anti-anti-sigma factor